MTAPAPPLPPGVTVVARARMWRVTSGTAHWFQSTLLPPQPTKEAKSR